VAIAFEPTANEIDGIVKRFESPPLDPRFEVSWQITGSNQEVRIDARDAAGSSYLNGLTLSLALRDSASNEAAEETRPIPQVAPGRYALTFPAPRAPRVATVLLDPGEKPTVIARGAVAGRYASEFDAIGNDRAAMKELARRSGGRIIEPNESGPLALRSLAPAEARPLSSALATAGAVCVAGGLLIWRRSA
jgi:hypothetical protein